MSIRNWIPATAMVICLFAAMSLSGCAVNRESAAVNPGVKATDYKKFYVVKYGPDERGVNRLIRDRLSAMGYDASTGPENQAPSGTDALVEYQDKWYWDITMYMIALNVTFKDPNTKRSLATGASLHTSLTRKSPEEMVKEVLTNMFKKMQQAKIPTSSVISSNASGLAAQELAAKWKPRK